MTREAYRYARKMADAIRRKEVIQAERGAERRRKMRETTQKWREARKLQDA